MDRPHFFFSFELTYPARPLKRRLGGLPRVGGQALRNTSCSPCLHCTEWSCVVLCGSPRHHNGSGRDWPHKATIRPEVTGHLPQLAGSRDDVPPRSSHYVRYSERRDLASAATRPAAD